MTLTSVFVLALVLTSNMASARPADSCVDDCMTQAGPAVVTSPMAQAPRSRPCARSCVKQLTATRKVNEWVSPRRYKADPEITVTVGHREVNPTYYHHNGELCIGYFSGFGTTTRVNVCGKSYKLRIKTQSFHQSRKVKVHYKLHYGHGG